MAIAKRITPAAPASGGTVNFGGPGFFTGGSLALPEGDYAVTFEFRMFTPTKKDGTPSGKSPFLALMANCHPIDRNGTLVGEPEEVPISCGPKAEESFLPSEDGKGLVAVPGGKGSMWKLSSFSYFFESLQQSGLPPGLITSSWEPLDGVWLHLQNIPEPEEKKAYSAKRRAKTGAAGLMAGVQQEEEKDYTILVASEILEGGRPWEGSGGIPDENAAPKKPAVGAKKAVAAPVKKAAPAPVAEEIDEETLGNAALEAVATVLGNNPTGCAKAKLKVETFAAAKKANGDDVAQMIMETYLNDDATLGALLEQVGFKIAGVMVKPA